jgi:drug/metabolite transporter (DMT)-like permease
VPADLLPPAIAVVVLGLTSSLTWGISDFFGGLTVRRAPLLAVMAFTQLVGVVMALPLVSLHGEPVPAGPDIAWSVASGLLGAVGLGCLYHGLAVGRMGVVAPIAGVLVAGIPVAVGIVLQGAPPVLALAGILLAIVSVAVVSRVPAETEGRSSGFWWGLAAGVALGGLTVTISRITPGFVFGPLVIVRSTEAVLCVVAIVVSRRAWRIPRALWPAALAIGLFDVTGTATYLAAIQIGPLAIAAVLSGLYPAVTVLLAAAVLRERLTRVHVIGVVAAVLGVVLIAGGQAS